MKTCFAHCTKQLGGAKLLSQILYQWYQHLSHFLTISIRDIMITSKQQHSSIIMCGQHTEIFKIWIIRKEFFLTKRPENKITIPSYYYVLLIHIKLVQIVNKNMNIKKNKKADLTNIKKILVDRDRNERWIKQE